MKYINKYSLAAGVALATASVVAISLFVAAPIPIELVADADQAAAEITAETESTDIAKLRPAQDDHQTDERRVTQSYSYSPPIFSDTPTGRQLKTFFSLLDEFGADAAKNYALALQKIKADPKAPRELIAAYGRLNAEPSEQHYKILYTLEELKSPEALSLLINVATSEIPARPESLDVEHSANEGTLMRMRAIAGLRNLAEGGNSMARDTLLRVVQESPDLTLRGEAVINYLAISKNVARDSEFLKALLPAEQHYLVTTQVKLPTIPNFQTANSKEEH